MDGTWSVRCPDSTLGANPEPYHDTWDPNTLAGTDTLTYMNRPGMSGDSTSWEGWSHVRWFVEEVSAGAA